MTRSGSELRTLVERGISLARAQQYVEAEAIFREAIRQDPNAVAAHSFLGALAFATGRYDEAVTAYQACVRLFPSQAEFHFNLGTAREKANDLAGAIDAYLNAYRRNRQDSRFALFAGAALEAAGRRADAAIMFSLGDDVDPTMRGAKDRGDLHPEVRARSAVADRVMRAHFSDLHRRSVDEAERDMAGPDGQRTALSRVREAIWIQTNDGPVTYRTPKQEPSLFYVPDLKASPSTPSEQLSWAPTIEAATDEIRGEYLAAVRRGAQLSPYVESNVDSAPWQSLRGRSDWSSLHLFKLANETPFAKLFPKTLKALEAADIVRVKGGTPIEIFFSRLKPGTHIPPHFGAANNRLTVHLPLIVPDNCGIRIANEMHTWREGKVLAFDDSFEHEAWNKSTSERVVLIFESHHPDLSAAERRAIELAFDRRERWLSERRIPDFARSQDPL